MDTKIWMKIWTTCAIAPAATLIAAVLLPAPAAAQAEVHELRGDRVAIHNVAGRVRIHGSSGDAVTVRVSRGGADGSRLRVETGPGEEGVSLRVAYPGDRIVYPRLRRGSRSEFRVSEEGVIGRGDRKVRVSGRGSGLEAYADLEIGMPPGRQLVLHHGVGEVEAAGIRGDLRLDGASGRVEAREIRGSLGIDTGSGNVAVVDVEGDRLHVDTGSGSVSLTDVRADQILVDTGSGRVSGSRVSGRELRFDTGSGAIRLDGVAATDLRADTGSGSIRLALDGDVRSAELDTGSGGVTLLLPEGLGAELDVETGSGRIDFDFPITVVRAARDHLVGRVGDGGGRIRVETGSGSVRLRRP